jgi:hypothetical protein
MLLQLFKPHSTAAIATVQLSQLNGSCKPRLLPQVHTLLLTQANIAK